VHADACCQQQRRACASFHGIDETSPDRVRGLQDCRAMPRKTVSTVFRANGLINAKNKSASSPCAKEVLSLRNLALKEFVLRTTLFPITEQLRCSLTSHGVLGVLVERR